MTSLDEVGQVQLWDPLTGSSYRPNDPKCPLTAVYCVADQTNVYYNVQRTSRLIQSRLVIFSADVRPSRINWNFDSWQKLWPTVPEHPLESIQISQFQYDPINTNAALR